MLADLAVWKKHLICTHQIFALHIKHVFHRVSCEDVAALLLFKSWLLFYFREQSDFTTSASLSVLTRVSSLNDGVADV